MYMYAITAKQGNKHYNKWEKGRYSRDSLVVGDTRKAAVVLVAAALVLHARVDDAAHRYVHVVGTQVLEQVHYLAALRLRTKERQVIPESTQKLQVYRISETWQMAGKEGIFNKAFLIQSHKKIFW